MSLHPLIIKSLQNKPLSLADLQLLTQVSLPTLRKAVQELADARWICIVGQSETKGGRPAMLFGLDDSHFLILGVHLQLPGMRMILCDLSGQVLEETERFQGVQPGPDEVLQAVVEYATEMAQRYGSRSILGVGLAAPGFTDLESGAIVSIGRVAGWQNYPICQRITDALGIPVRIANDVDCMAFAEFQQTGKSFASNLAYVGFDEGVKVSLFLNGELYRGAFGNTGLVVSRLLRTLDDSIGLDEQQQLLTISGINALFKTAVAALDEAAQQPYQPILSAHYRQRPILIFDCAQDLSLPICDRIRSRITTVLAAAVTNMVCIIQPDTVVIGGMLSGISEDAFTRLSASIREQLPLLFANQVTIEQAQVVSSNRAALGAAFHFLDDYVTLGALDKRLLIG